MIIERLKSGVITVGHGRGFVVEGAGERLVITAAHCLPSLPPSLSSFGLKARTYGPLLARRGEEPRAWAVCRFVDPIADIAVLGSPDNPHADDYKALMGTATALSFGDAVRRPVNFWAPARLLSLDGRWFSCTIRHFGGPLWITHAAERVLGGMSGSPIVAEAGTAIGVVCTPRRPGRAVLTRASATTCRDGCSATPCRWPACRCFPGSMAGLYAALSTPHERPHGSPRMTRPMWT